MSDKVDFYGSVPSSTLKKALFQATGKALIGLIAIPFSFIIGALLLAWAFIPYQRLKSMAPQLTVTDKFLSYEDGQKSFSLQLKEIKNLSYENDLLRLHLVHRVIDLPYFSYRTFQELKALIASS